MSGKNQFPIVYNWQSISPIPTFLPVSNPAGSTPSGNPNGVMTGTTAIYSQINDVSRMDNIGLEVFWTGNPVGTFEVLGSNSGKNFFVLAPTDFTPTLVSPVGVAGGYGVNINQWSWKYILLRYTNISGSGVLTVTGQNKDLN